MLFSWIAISKIEMNAYESICSNDYIKVNKNPGFLKPIGFVSPRAYRPWLISPLIDVWQEIERRINREMGGHARGRSQVLTIAEAGDAEERVFSFTIRFYRPNIIAIEVRLKTEVDISLAEAFRFRELAGHPCVYAAVDSLIGIIRSGSASAYPRQNSFYSRPAIIIANPGDETVFQDWRESNKSIISNLLINNQNYEYSSDDLAEDIFSRNKDVDAKFSRGAFSLISKQGILTAYAGGPPVVAVRIPDEHRKRVLYLEYALVLAEFISSFVEMRQKTKIWPTFFFFLVCHL
jgi:hypothetical protein